MIDGTSADFRSVVVPAGTYEINRIANPFGESTTAWIVLDGTMIGGSEEFFRRMDHAAYGEFRISLDDGPGLPIVNLEGSMAAA